MLYYYRLDLRKEIHVTKKIDSKESFVCHYWYFNHRLKFQKSFCNGCHYLSMMCRNISNIAIINVKGVDYHCIISDISKSDATIF